MLEPAWTVLLQMRTRAARTEMAELATRAGMRTNSWDHLLHYYASPCHSYVNIKVLKILEFSFHYIFSIATAVSFQ